MQSKCHLRGRRVRGQCGDSGIGGDLRYLSEHVFSSPLKKCIIELSLVLQISGSASKCTFCCNGAKNGPSTLWFACLLPTDRQTFSVATAINTQNTVDEYSKPLSRANYSLESGASYVPISHKKTMVEDGHSQMQIWGTISQRWRQYKRYVHN